MQGKGETLSPERFPTRRVLQEARSQEMSFLPLPLCWWRCRSYHFIQPYIKI